MRIINSKYRKTLIFKRNPRICLFEPIFPFSSGKSRICHCSCLWKYIYKNLITKFNPQLWYISKFPHGNSSTFEIYWNNLKSKKLQQQNLQNSVEQKNQKLFWFHFTRCFFFSSVASDNSTGSSLSNRPGHSWLSEICFRHAWGQNSRHDHHVLEDGHQL